MAVDLPETAQVDIRPAVEYNSGKIVGDDFAAANDLDPLIVSVTGTIADEQDITLSGFNLGTKAVVAPWVDDNFEGETPGTQLTSIASPYTSYGIDPTLATISNARSKSGTQSARVYTPDTRAPDPDESVFESCGKTGLNSKTMYAFFRVWGEKVSGSQSYAGAFNKFLRINSAPNFYTSTPSFFITSYPTDVIADGYCTIGFNNGATTYKAEPITLLQGQWNDIEIQYVLSSALDVADGLAICKFNGVTKFMHPTGVTLATGAPAGAASVLDNFLLSAMVDRDGIEQNHDSDRVYVDNTLARIIISTAPQFADIGSDFAIASPKTTWNATTAICTIKDFNGLPAGNKYIYLVNEFGRYNFNGKLL